MYESNFCTEVFTDVNSHVAETHIECAQDTNNKFSYIQQSSDTCDSAMKTGASNVISLNNTHACEVCRKTFLDNKGLESHKITEHNLNDNVQGKSKNSECSVWKLDENDKQSIDIVVDKHLKCDICGKFVADYVLENHRKAHHDLIYECVLCQAKFSRKQALDNHCRKSHHGDISADCNELNSNLPPSLISQYLEGTDAPTKKYKCNFCSEIFIDLKSANSHAVTTHKMCTQGINNEFNSIQVSSDAYHDVTEVDVSDNACSTNTVLNNIHACVVCSKRFPDYETLKNHKIIEHNLNDDRTYKCEICGKIFATSYGLQVHLIVHNSKIIYKCSSCYKTFTKRQTLRIHERSHAKLKPYQCEMCMKSFTALYGLIEHRRVHTGEKPHECERCEKRFGSRTKLLQHERRHLGIKLHQCDYCDRRFHTTSEKIVHEATHTGDQPYKCEICNKAFSQKSSVSRHMVTHTGEKRYKCDICGTCFAQRSAVKSHKIKTHFKNS